MVIHCLKISSLGIVILTLLLPFIAQKELQAEEQESSQAVYQPPEHEQEESSQTVYQPPEKEQEEEEEDETLRSVQRTPGGSRGGECNLLPPQIVTLIVPEDHIGTTSLSRPTVIWFNREPISQPVKFTVNAHGSKPILVREFDNLPKGFRALKLPESSPGLEIGKLYKWTVTVVCNEVRPSKNLYAQAWIKRVPKPVSERSENLNCNIDFAKLGIWYDAILCSYSQLNLPKDHSSFQEKSFNFLLEQIDLSELKFKGLEDLRDGSVSTKQN